MERNKLIGMLCIAANKAGVELTAWEIYRLASALESELAMDAKTEIPPEILAKEKAREPKIPVYEESIPMPSPEIMERLEKKKAQTHATDSKIESVDAPVETPSEQVSDQPAPQVAPQPSEKVAPAAPVHEPILKGGYNMESVQESVAPVDEPKTAPVKEKASGDELTPRQKQLWEYVQAHKDASVEQICTELNIEKQAYYNRKSELKKKGYIFSVCEEDTAKIRATQKRFNIITAEEQSDMNQRMEDAYLGEHPNIQPEPVQRKPVSAKAQRLYEYMKSHPDSRMPKTCEDLGICNGDYYMLKAQLKKNGWIESAVENVQAY